MVHATRFKLTPYFVMTKQRIRNQDAPIIRTAMFLCVDHAQHGCYVARRERSIGFKDAGYATHKREARGFEFRVSSYGFRVGTVRVAGLKSQVSSLKSQVSGIRIAGFVFELETQNSKLVTARFARLF
jgi:hypothetical protein